MNQLELAIAAGSLLVFLLGLYHKKLKTSLFNETLIATLCGVALGPYGLNLLQPATWPHTAHLMKEAAWLTLCPTLMAIALRLPPTTSAATSARRPRCCSW